LAKPRKHEKEGLKTERKSDKQKRKLPIYLKKRGKRAKGQTSNNLAENQQKREKGDREKRRKKHFARLN